MPIITHQQFANETILPKESIIEEAQNLKEIIKTNMEASGQNFNTIKSEIFILNTPPKKEREICNIMGFRKLSFPYKYLRVQLDKSLRNSKIWNLIIDKVSHQI